MYSVRIGTPFCGRELERLTEFLQQQELRYDESITYTVMLEDEGTIAATGSCHNNVMKCVAVAPAYRGQNLLSEIMTRLTAHFFSEGITHYFGFTKPKNRVLFGGMGLYPVAETENVLLLENRKNGLKRYLTQLTRQTEQTMGQQTVGKGSGIGAIVANCNPFTRGHRYLMETAAGQCEWLHVFILSEEQGMFGAEERFRMVQDGVQDISNIILHPTSDYLISPAVFPTYFIKDKSRAYEINCMLDITLFCEAIASELHITKRFVGSEPLCAITNAYNTCLKQCLPKYGIQLMELPRLETGGRVISASAVREAMQRGMLQEVADMLPESTFTCLKRREHDAGTEE